MEPVDINTIIGSAMVAVMIAWVVIGVLMYGSHWWMVARKGR